MDTIREELWQDRCSIHQKILQTKIVTVVVDEATSVAIEITDDTEETFEEASAVAVYSK